MKKKILYIDMDGVIADFKRYVISNSDITEEDFINSNCAIEQRVDEFCISQPRLFKNLKPITGAVEAVNKLFDIYDVYFLSTPMYCLPESYMDKRIWLEKHFGDKAQKRLILTHRKDLVKGDCLIDDRIKNGAKEFDGRFIHFGSKEYIDWNMILRRLFVSQPIEDYDVSVRIINALKEVDITSLHQLSNYKKSEILKIKNFGSTSLKELEELMKVKGLRFRN